MDPYTGRVPLMFNADIGAYRCRKADVIIDDETRVAVATQLAQTRGLFDAQCRRCTFVAVLDYVGAAAKPSPSR